MASTCNLDSTLSMTGGLSRIWDSPFEIQTAEARIKRRTLSTWRDIREYWLLRMSLWQSKF